MTKISLRITNVRRANSDEYWQDLMSVTYCFTESYGGRYRQFAFRRPAISASHRAWRPGRRKRGHLIHSPPRRCAGPLESPRRQLELPATTTKQLPPGRSWNGALNPSTYGPVPLRSLERPVDALGHTSLTSATFCRLVASWDSRLRELPPGNTLVLPDECRLTRRGVDH